MMVRQRIRGMDIDKSESPFNDYGYGSDFDCYWTNHRMFRMSNLFVNGPLSKNSIYIAKDGVGGTFTLENCEDVEMTIRRIRLRYKNGIR